MLKIYIKIIGNSGSPFGSQLKPFDEIQILSQVQSSLHELYETVYASQSMVNGLLKAD